MTNHLVTQPTIAFLLDEACSTPEDFQEWSTWEEKARVSAQKDPEAPIRTYPGWMRFVIDVHCKRFVIVARLRKDGSYAFRDFIMQEI